MKKHIAIVGGGISGLSAALCLSEKYDVTIFEKERELGGHARTVDISFDDAHFSVDVGFMVFNPPEYPLFSKLIEYLQVQTEPTNMSFSVSVGDGEVEFSGAFPTGIFADRKKIFSPSFYKFLLEILRFNKVARKALKTGAVGNISLKTFLDTNSFSTFFRYHYLFPMAGSIWSGSFGDIENFPAEILLTFLDRHHLLEVGNKPQWRTIIGGSRSYVKKLEERLKEGRVTVATGTTISTVRRMEDSCVLVLDSNQELAFDYVVMATHSDITLQILEKPTEDESSILDVFGYNENKVVLHSDDSNMPKRRAVWSSWNFCCPPSGRAEEIYLTYRMNSLQHIPEKYPVFVTLNPQKPIRSDATHAEFTFAHPVFTGESVKAQTRIPQIQGQLRTYFCGAYMGYGFHEDGLAAGIEVARLLGAQPPWE